MKLKKNFQKPSRSHYFESILRIKKKSLTEGSLRADRWMTWALPGDTQTTLPPMWPPTPEKSLLLLGSQHSR